MDQNLFFHKAGGDCQPFPNFSMLHRGPGATACRTWTWQSLLSRSGCPWGTHGKSDTKMRWLTRIHENGCFRVSPKQNSSRHSWMSLSSSSAELWPGNFDITTQSQTFYRALELESKFEEMKLRSNSSLQQMHGSRWLRWPSYPLVVSRSCWKLPFIVWLVVWNIFYFPIYWE